MNETQSLPVVLSQSELLARGKESGELSLSISQVEEDLAAAKVAAKEKLKTFEARKRELDRVLRSGIETRDVECELRFDFDAGVARTIRLDTKEVVSERPVTDEERQTSLTEAMFREPPPARRVREAAKKKADDDGLDDFMARQEQVIARQKALGEKTHTGRPSKKKARAA
jgi:hypothetical protein